MSGLPGVVSRWARSAFVRIDEWLLARRDRLTPGQRWTAALALALTVIVLAFGIPREVVVVPGPVAAAAGGGPDRAVVAAPQDPTTAPPGSPATVGPGAAPASAAVASLASPADLAAATAGPSAVPLPRVLPASPPAVVALVRTGGGALPGRDDAAIAGAFTARAGFGVTSVDVADPDACRKASNAGRVALAGEGLPGTLRDCLVAAGVAVVAYDDAGDRPPAGVGAGQVVSTRRGVADTLVDLAAWAGVTRAAPGTVGLVAPADRRDVIQPLLPRLRAAGLRVVTVAYVGGAADVADGVRAFAARGVSTVVFAAPVAIQQQWVTQQSVLDAGVRYVVADTDDAVLDEMYPAVFDGAIAYTALRVPWFARDHGETRAQALCRRVWEAAVTPATTMAGGEQLRVFAWCEHVAVVDAALSAMAAGRPLAEAIRSVDVVSPLTSDLGPLPGGGFGPLDAAVLEWRASCSCWRELRPYAPRPRPS